MVHGTFDESRLVVLRVGTGERVGFRDCDCDCVTVTVTVCATYNTRDDDDDDDDGWMDGWMDVNARVVWRESNRTRRSGRRERAGRRRDETGTTRPVETRREAYEP